MSADVSTKSQQHYLSVIRQGDVLGKYGRQGGMKTRSFILSRDGQRLEFRGRGTRMHRIPFKSVMLVAPGRESANFKSKDSALLKSNPEKLRALSRISFSMHYYDADGFSRSLDVQCLGNQDRQRSPGEQYEIWFTGLSMLVQIVRTYDLVPQALLSADSHHLVASEVAMTEQGSHSSTRSMARTSAPKRPSTTLSAVPPRAYPDQAEESCSEVSYNTRTSTDIESYCGRPNAAASSMSASDSGVAGWQGSVKTPQGRNSLHESGRNGNDSNGVFVCGRDILQVDDGKQSAAAALVRRVHALAGMDVQQTSMADRSIIAVTAPGAVYAVGTTSDGETFATVTHLQGLMNYVCKQVTCGHSATFVLTSKGTLLAWGRCASGLLGTTSRASIFSPKLIKFMQPGVSPRELRIRSISAGMHHAAAVSDGMMLFTWGDGAYGRLGHGSMDSCYEPRQVTALQHRHVATVSCGHYHTAAICCDMAATGHEDFIQRTPDVMESYDESIAGESIARASTMNCASGTLYTWGGVFGTQGNFLSSSNEGCLGLPSLEKHEGVDKPHAVELSDVVDVACGLNFTVAITTGGAVYQMGSMLRQGPLQAAPWESTSQPTRVRGVLGEVHAVRVVSGKSHALIAARPAGLESAGAVPTLLATWGSNDHGQLGRQIPTDRAGNNSSRRAPGEPLLPPAAELVHWLTPALVGDMRHSPITSMSASADTSCIVVQLPRGVLATLSRSTNSSTLRKPTPNAPQGSPTPGGRGRFNPAKALLQTVRPGVRGPERSDKPQRPQVTNTAQAGVVMLNSTMPPSSWVDHKAPGPRAPHLVRSSSAEAIPDLMMGPRRKPAVLLPTIPPSLQSSAAAPPSQALLPEATITVMPDIEDEKEVPPPALAYGSTAEMMRKLNRDGGRLKGLASLPASPATGSTNREVERQAVEDRLAWLEQVINDRNMGFSITGSSPEDDTDGAVEPQARRLSAKTAEARGEELACLLAEFQPMDAHNRPRRPHSASAAAMASHVAMEPPVATTFDRQPNGFKSPLATPQQIMKHTVEQRSPAMMLNPPPPRPVHKPYIPGVHGSEPLPPHDQVHLDGASHQQPVAAPTANTAPDEATDTQEERTAPAEEPQRVQKVENAGTAVGDATNDQPLVTANQFAAKQVDASTEAVQLPANASLSTLSPGFTFLNSQTEESPEARAATEATRREEHAAAAGNTTSHDPFSNVWQHLQTPTTGAQLLSISNSEGGTGVGLASQGQAVVSAPASTQAASPAATAAAAAVPLIRDTTSETAALRMQIEKLRKQSQEEKEARKAIEARALDLRIRLAAARGESGEAAAAPSASGQPRENLTRFRSLVEHNPVIVDSFWVPVDDGVSARLDVAEYTVLGKLKFSSRLFDNRAVKEWYRQNKHKVEVGNLVASTLGTNPPTTSAPGETGAGNADAAGADVHAVYGTADGRQSGPPGDAVQQSLFGPTSKPQLHGLWGSGIAGSQDTSQVSQAALQRFLDDSFAAGGPDRMT